MSNSPKDISRKNYAVRNVYVIYSSISFINQIYLFYLHTHELIHNIISLFIKSKMSLSSEKEVQKNMNRHCIEKYEL